MFAALDGSSGPAVALAAPALLIGDRGVHEVRILRALARRRVTVDPGGIRAQGWSAPVRVPAGESGTDTIFRPSRLAVIYPLVYGGLACGPRCAAVARHRP